MSVCTLQLPRNYIAMNAEEMTYIDGGSSATTHGAIATIRNELDKLITLCIAGNVSSAALAIFGGVISKLIAGITASWFTNTLSHTTKAHHTAETLIRQHGQARRGFWFRTWNSVGWVTGMQVDVI